MKIGIFDSGIGGLYMTRAIRAALSEYDLVYLGDTLHVPYGRRSKETIYDLTRAAVKYLFEKEDCQLVILACNTASAAALRKLQQSWLVANFPDRRILGVIVPTLEASIALGHTRIGLIGTESTVNAGVYEEELRKLNPGLQIFAKATPLLVPMVEHDGIKYIMPVLQDYLAPLKDADIQSLILGCTHYPFIASQILACLPGIPLISQSDIVPNRLKDYLARHPEHDAKVSRHATSRFLVTDLTAGYQTAANAAYGAPVDLLKVSYMD